MRRRRCQMCALACFNTSGWPRKLCCPRPVDRNLQEYQLALHRLCSTTHRHRYRREGRLGVRFELLLA